MTRFTRLVPVLITLLAFFAVPFGPGDAKGQEAAAAAQGLERFNGSWRYGSSASRGRDIIERAVVRAVDGMNFITQPIATGRLRGKNPLVQRIDINLTSTDARVVFDGNRTYRGALNAWTSHSFDGETLNVQFRHRGDSLVQLFRSDSGTRRNVYRLLRNGGLRLEVTLQSGSLPRDMTYSLDYRR